MLKPLCIPCVEPGVTLPVTESGFWYSRGEDWIEKWGGMGETPGKNFSSQTLVDTPRGGPERPSDREPLEELPSL